MPEFFHCGVCASPRYCVIRAAGGQRGMSSRAGDSARAARSDVRRGYTAAELHIEAEEHDIPVLYFVVLAFQSHLSRFFCGG